MGAVSKQTQDIIDALGAFAEFGTDDALWDDLRRPEACDGKPMWRTRSGTGGIQAPRSAIAEMQVRRPPTRIARTRSRSVPGTQYQPRMIRSRRPAPIAALIVSTVCPLARSSAVVNVPCAPMAARLQRGGLARWAAGVGAVRPSSARHLGRNAARTATHLGAYPSTSAGPRHFGRLLVDRGPAEARTAC